MEPIPSPPDPFAIADREAVSVGDLAPFLAELFFMPGNWLLWAAASYTPALARFLEIGAHGYGGLLAACLSALTWIAALVVVSITWRAVRDFDEALTSSIVRGYADLLRRLRIAYSLAIYRLRQRDRPTESGAVLEIAEELELDDRELRLLRAYAELGPGHALPVSEAAAAIGCRRHEIQQALDRLKALQLLRTTLGGPDGENAYVLTSAGRGLLVFKQLTSKAALTPSH